MATPRSTLSVSFASTFVIGVLSGALGPLIPGLATRLSVPVETLGALFTALFLGALALQFAGGWLNEWLGLRTMVMVGTALLTVGIGGLALSSTLPLLLACAAIAGAGQGAIDASTNVLVASVYDGRRVVSAVNLLHFAFGAGAVLSPMAAAWATQRWGTPMPALGVAVLLGIANLAIAFRALMNPSVARHGDAPRAAGRRGLYGRPELWGLSLLLFLYVGVEMGVGGWTAVYLGRTTALGPAAIAWVLSGYWLALTGGRLLGALVGAQLSARALTALSLGGSVAGAALLVAGGAAGGAVPLTLAGTLLCGLSFGPVFPTVLVVASELFKEAPSRAMSTIIATSSLGGMVLPPLQGVLLTRVSPLASVVLVAVACALQLTLLRLVARGSAPEIAAGSST